MQAVMCSSNVKPADGSTEQEFGMLNFIKYLFLILVIRLHALVDFVIDLCFSLYFKGCKCQVPVPKKKIQFYSAVDLAKEIKSKKITSEEVVQTYINRILEINPILNCVVDDRFEEALQEARKIDENILNGSYTFEQLENLPFLGVPFSTKVSTCVKGLRHTIGLVSRRHTIAEDDADVVKAMRAAGAIPLAVTNVPELGMWYETWSTLHGQTFNPYDTTRTTGGSSGGEAALIAACGSPIGIGTDIGGSLRMPAFFCGLFAHKPTSGLTPLKGLNRRTGDERQSMVSAGPMSCHSKDLLPALRVLVGQKVNSLKLNVEVDPGKIKYYFMVDDSSSDDGIGGDLRLSAMGNDLHTCMLKVASYLREKNTSVQEVRIAGMRHGFCLWRYWMTQEPEKFSRELANREGEVCIWTELPKKIFNLSDFSLPALMRLVDEKLPPVNEKWARETTSKLRGDILSLLGDDAVLLYPSHPFPAFYRNSSLLRPYNFAYTAVLNVLNLPVTQVPLGLNSEGLPVGLQVVGSPLNDHLTLAVARDLEEAFGGWLPPSQTP